MKLCRTCGAPLEDDVMFCHMCGTKIEEEEMAQEAEGTTVLSDDTYFEEMQQSPMFESDNGTTILDENFAPMPEIPEQPTVSQKKKISKGALIAIVISALLVVIIAVVAIVLFTGKDDPYDDYGYYDNDSYNYENEEDFISFWWDNLIFDEEFSDTYPVAIIRYNDEIAWIEYNDDFTKYKINLVVSSDEHCQRWYSNSRFMDFSDVDYYPKRYELTVEEYFDNEELENLLYGYYHTFEIWGEGYIDHVESFDSEYNIDDAWDDICDSNGEITG